MRKLQLPNRLPVRSLALNPDNTLLAVGQQNDRKQAGRCLSIWTFPELVHVATIPTEDSTYVNGVAFLKDGHRLLYGLNEGNIYTVNTRTWEPEGVLLQTPNIQRIVLHRASGSLAVVGDHVQVWDTVSRNLLWDSGHTEAEILRSAAVCFGSDEKTLIVAGHGRKTIQFWDIDADRKLRSIPAPETGAIALAYDPKNEVLLLSSGPSHRLFVLDAQAGWASNIEPLLEDISVIAVERSWERVYVGFLGGRIEQNDGLTGRVLKAWNTDVRRIEAMLLSDDERYLISGGEGGIVTVWEPDAT